jgi:hypothetical protein
MHYLHWATLYKSWAELFWSRLLKGYCSCPKRFNEHAIPFLRYPRNKLGSITYLLKGGGVFHSPAKIYKETNAFIRVFGN